MGNFDLVTSEIEGAGWYPFLSNLEDGYIVYHIDDDTKYELIYADWDLMDGSEHVRLIDPAKDYQESEIIRCDIVGGEDDIVNDLRNFFWDAGGYTS